MQKSRALRPASVALSTNLSAAAIWVVADSSRISYSCANPPWLTSLHSDGLLRSPAYLRSTVIWSKTEMALLGSLCRRDAVGPHCMINAMAYRLLRSDQNRALAAVERGIRRISAL